MPEWGCSIKPKPPQSEGPEDMPFTSPVRCKMVRGAQEHVKSSVVALFLVPDLRATDAVAEFYELNARDLIGTQSKGSQVGGSTAWPRAR